MIYSSLVIGITGGFPSGAVDPRGPSQAEHDELQWHRKAVVSYDNQD